MYRILILFSLLVLLPNILLGQNSYLSFGVKNNGICFGNSKSYNGIRFNFYDKDVNKINGLTLTIAGNVLSSEGKNTNGVSFGLVNTADSTMNGIQASGLATLTKHGNGISLAPFILAEKFNGLQFAGLASFVDTTNGVMLSGFGSTPFEYIGSEVINGLAIGGITINSEKVNGVTIASILCFSEKLNGVSIAGINITKELNGVQFGLINYAANNRKIFRILPFVNLNFSRKTA